MAVKLAQARDRPYRLRYPPPPFFKKSRFPVDRCLPWPLSKRKVSRRDFDMNIVVTGSTGFVGSALVPFLADRGHEVTRLVRGQTHHEERHVSWDPERGTIDTVGLEGVDAVVHLAGENITAGRWTESRKGRIRRSRVNGTKLLSDTLTELDSPPRVLVCASASGYYGDKGDEILTEDSGPGTDFLAQTVRDWEAATETAAKAGIRTVTLRSGLVLGPGGGVLARMLPPFRLGLGGNLGSGRQYVSWISLVDALSAIHHVLLTEALSGPLNVASPNAVRNADFTRTLGRVLRRPTFLSVPRLALRVGLGELADSVLSSARLDPSKLIASGFVFRHPHLEDALREVLGGS